jgi:frataxin-like iron-binding protein CyaY
MNNSRFEFDVEDQKKVTKQDYKTVHPVQQDQPDQTFRLCNLTFKERELENDEMSCNFCWIFWWLIVAVIIIACISKSFWYVSFDEYTLRRNTYNGVTLSKVYTQNRYFLPLTESMVYFPSVFNEVTYTSQTFAENGLEFECLITFYYRLPKDKIGEIYNSYSMNYDLRVINNAKQIVKNIASTFSVVNFLENRIYIEKTIAIELEIYLKNTIGVDAPKEYFKIINIVFPTSLMDASLTTAIALQNNQIQLYQQEVDVINADTNKLKARIDAETNRTLEFANNEASQIITNSQSQANQIVLVSRSTGIKKVCTALNISTSEDTNKLTRAFAIMDNTNDVTMLNDVNSGVLLQKV